MTRLQLVIPTLDSREKWLEQSLVSVRDQRIDCQVTIVCPQPSAALIELGERFKCDVVIQKSSGLSAAINEGWKYSQSEYVAWLGDDDLLAPLTLHVSLETFNRDASQVMVYGDCRVIDAEDKTTHFIRPGRFAKFLLPWGPDLLPQPGSIYRRSSVELVNGLNEALNFAMDLDLFLKLMKVGKISYIPIELASFRRHDTSLTVTNPAPGIEARQVRASQANKRLAPFLPVLEPLGLIVGRVWSRFHARHGRRLEKRIREDF